MGQQGQIRGKVTDEALKGLLEQVRYVYTSVGRTLLTPQVSGPGQAKTPAPTVAPSARTKTLGGGIIVSLLQHAFCA